MERRTDNPLKLEPRSRDASPQIDPVLRRWTRAVRELRLLAALERLDRRLDRASGTRAA